MLVIIKGEFFSDPSCHIDLRALLAFSVRNRCYLRASIDAAEELSVWLAKESKETQKAWENSEEWALRDEALFRLRPRQPVYRAHGDNTQELKRVLQEVEQGTKIWVENDRNDRAFWLAMAGPDRRRSFEMLEKNGVIEWTSRGGLNELRVSLEARVAKRTLPLSNWVLFDSDSVFPGVLSKEAERMSSFCQENDVKYYCLSRRSIENYLPQKALYEVWCYSPGRQADQRRRKSKVECLFKMSQAQRNHFHMKTGFPKVLPKDEAALFDGVPEGDMSLLSDGFGKDLADIYDKHTEWLSGIPKDGGAQEELDPPLDAILQWVRAPHA